MYAPLEKVKEIIRAIATMYKNRGWLFNIIAKGKNIINTSDQALLVMPKG